jgi:hypothetical protein
VYFDLVLMSVVQFYKVLQFPFLLDKKLLGFFPFLLPIVAQDLLVQVLTQKCCQDRFEQFLAS